MKKKPSSKKVFDTIITSHINADFDAMASMLAAQKLYPEAVALLPQPYVWHHCSIPRCFDL